jgi:hypothetical protein
VRSDECRQVQTHLESQQLLKGRDNNTRIYEEQGFICVLSNGEEKRLRGVDVIFYARVDSERSAGKVELPIRFEKLGQVKVEVIVGDPCLCVVSPVLDG